VCHGGLLFTAGTVMCNVIDTVSLAFGNCECRYAGNENEGLCGLHAGIDWRLLCSYLDLIEGRHGERSLLVAQ
jgi:hypothetical protein